MVAIILLLLNSALACPSAANSPVSQQTGEVFGCATMAHRAHLQSARGCPTPKPPPPPPQRADEKQVRDAYGAFPNVEETAHFAIKWGIFDDFSRSDIAVLADALEASWAHEIETMGYPGPLGTETYKVNVYIGNTHESAPTINPSVKAYVTLDPEGYAQIVFSPRYLGDHADLQLTAAHEFFHAIQWHANDDYAFGQDEPASWYWEATSVWMENEVFDQNMAYADHIAGFLFYPELPLNYFATPSTGSLSEYHAYGAFLFPRYLGEHGPGKELIRASFTNTNGDNDPLSVLDTLLKEEGSNLKDVFFSFAEANATLHYSHRNAYLDYLDDYGGYLSVYSNRPTGVLSQYNTGWITRAEGLPVSWSANYWEIWSPDDRFAVDIESQELGTWHAAIVAFDGTEHSVVSETWEGMATQTLVFSTEAEEVWLLVATAHPEEPQRPHPYKVRYRPLAEDDTGTPTDTGEISEPKSCGCSSGPGLPLWMSVFALLTYRRRLKL